MILTQEQQAILNGERGEVLAKVMKTLVMYGEAFGAERMVPVTSKYNHLVTSFGLKMMTPVFDLMQQLIDAGVTSEQKFSVYYLREAVWSCDRKGKGRCNVCKRCRRLS